MKKTGRKLFSVIAAALVVLAMTASAFAQTMNVSTINTDRTGSFDIYKYDITNAEKDGVWDSSYVSTGVRDTGVEDILGSDTRKSSLNANGEVNGYAVKGVEFTYLKVADICTYTGEADGATHTEVLYGIGQNEANDAFLSAIGVSAGDRYVPADSVGNGSAVYYYRSDTLINVGRKRRCGEKRPGAFCARKRRHCLGADRQLRPHRCKRSSSRAVSPCRNESP